ncbi:integral membrane protein [Desulfovibrio ferrophilus]|uniref:Integral membrane protein n=1 Tax=Desulfovibrio ferrophilus TaxID=241368 RepID=A0A2Z6AW71_9BACT|nr:integral membrane protein [Desulfovibrio ferrophilus]
MGLFIQGIAEVLSIVLNLYMWIVIISALLSWVNPDPYNPIVRTLRNLTEPVFWRVRSWLPFLNIGGLDLTPIVILLGIVFLKTVLVGNLFRLAMHMG